MSVDNDHLINHRYLAAFAVNATPHANHRLRAFKDKELSFNPTHALGSSAPNAFQKTNYHRFNTRAALIKSALVGSIRNACNTSANAALSQSGLCWLSATPARYSAEAFLNR